MKRIIFLTVASGPAKVFSLFDRNWTLIGGVDLAAKLALEATTTKAVNSVSGDNANAGTLASPKQTLAGIGSMTANAVLGLFRDSTWREDVGLVAHAAGIRMQDISGGVAGALPIVSAMDAAAFATNNGDGTYSHTWIAESGVANDGYNWVFVAEINTTTEATAPIASRAKMYPSPDLAMCIANPGYAFIESLGSNQWKATIHPTSGAPGGTYRYEVVARYIQVNFADPTASGTLSGIEFVGGSYGYGSLGGPRAASLDHLVFLHGTSHNAVPAGGSISQSLFYDNGYTNNVPLTFYDTLAAGRVWTCRNTYFIQQGQGILCHTSTADPSGNWAGGYVQNCVLKQTRLAIGSSAGSLYGQGLGADNINAVYYQQSYFEGCLLLVQATAVYSEMTDCVIRHCSQVVPTTLFKNNIVQLENGSNPTDTGKRNCFAFWTFPAGAVAQNNLYHLTHVASGNGMTDFGVNLYGSNPQGMARKNVYILDAASGQDAVLASFTSANPTYNYQSDYNVFLHISGNLKLVRSGAADVTTFAGYQATTGRDGNSLYIDLTADGRGVGAAFVDAANGNFQFANTDVGARVANYCRAHGVGPARTISYWPVIPAVDDVAAMIAAV